MPVESSYRMESARDFIGTEGGVIYAPANTFHASRFQGNGNAPAGDTRVYQYCPLVR